MGTLTAPPNDVPSVESRRRPRYIGIVALLLVAGFCSIPPLLAWQQEGEQSAHSLTNMRRIALGALLYSQDWDGRFMPLAKQQSNGYWLTWPTILRSYVGPDSAFDNPVNPPLTGGPVLRDPVFGYTIKTGYAFNRRFWNTFAPGPFPLEDLELAGQTALLVEAGPAWRSPLHRSPHGAVALLWYGDTTERINDLVPYPSAHSGRIAVAAADGHALLLHVEHYRPGPEPHDPLYGRIGGDLYNWNGGHPNGEVDRPPHE